MVQVALKAADIGHLAAPPSVHQRWTQKLTDEMFLQGDREFLNGPSLDLKHAKRLHDQADLHQEGFPACPIIWDSNFDQMLRCKHHELACAMAA